MKTLASSTEERATRARLSPVALVRLTTWTDRAAATVDQRFYFSTGPGARYQWSGDTTANHHPLVSSLDDLAVAIPHLPSGLPEDLPEKRLRVELANVDYNGERLAKVLREHTLENATLEVAQILLESQTAASFRDLTSEDVVIWYRGRVRRWGPISETSVPLECSFDFPGLTWLVATDATEVDPQDVGRRYPLPYGSAPRVPAIGRIVGWVTTLAEKIDNTAGTTLEVTDASGFADTGSAYIGSEKITWTGKTGNQLTGVTRGASSTTLAFHTAGEAVVEVTSGATFTLAGLEVSDIGDVFVRNPFTGDVVRVTTAHTETVDDAVTDSATTATVSVTAGQLEELITELSQSPEAQDVGGSASWTVEQHPDLQYCDSLLTTDTAIKRRYAPADGTSESTRTNKGSVEITSTNWYSCGFAEREPFTRLQKQQLKAYVYRTAGSGALVIKSSSLASGSGTTTYVSGTDWTASTDGVITLTTTAGDAGATDSRWWFETPAGTTWEIFEVWRNLDANEVGGYSFSQKTLGSFEVRDRDTGGLVHTTFASHVQDTDYNSGMTHSTDLDYAFRTEVSGGFDAKLYKLELAFGNTTGSYTTQAQQDRSIWYASTHFDHVGALDAINNPAIGGSDGDTFMVGDSDADVDSHGGTMDMDGSGYTDLWATGASSVFTFWIDGGLAEADGHDVLEIRPRSTNSDDLLVEARLYEVVADAAPTPSVAIQAASVGYGLRLFADVDGPVAPSVSPVYKAGTGSLIEDPADVLRHLIEVQGGGTIDSDSYDDLHDAMQNPEMEIWNSSTLGAPLNAFSTAIAYEDDFDDDANETGLVKIDDEWITYRAMSGSSVSSGERGVRGTTAVSHADASAIDIYPLPVTGLTAILTVGTTTATVSSTSAFPSEGTLGIEAEEMTYTGTTATTFTGLTRGVNGTTDVEHASIKNVFELAGSPVTFGGDLRPKGLTFREVLAGVAYECGANIVPVETTTSTEWKMLSPDVSGDFTASVATVTEWEPGGFVELGRDVEDELETRGVVLYDLDPSVEGGDDGAFRGALRSSATAAEHDLVSPTAAEISAVEDTLGRLDADSPRAYYLLHAAVDAGFISGRDLSDRLRIPRLVAISGVPWWESYTLEVGDIVSATPPWESVALKLRIIGYTKRFNDELVDLVLVEVT